MEAAIFRRRAFITGITGQDGAYLAKSLLDNDYEVFGSARPTSSPWRLEDLGVAGKVHLVPVDLLDFESIAAAIRRARPNEVYNLAAQSTLGESARDPALAGEINGLAVARLLEAIRLIDPTIRFAQASSSQMFGRPEHAPQDETTPFKPESPYAIAKLYGHLTAGYYRSSFGLHASTGILFNHESPLRGTEFVTRKIAQGLAAIALGGRTPLELGNLEARRDWGHAQDHVRAFRLMVAHGEPGDYVIATGKTHSVREFVEATARHLGLDLEWESASRARDRRSGRPIVETKAELFRKEPDQCLAGNAEKAKRELGWSPQIDFLQLVAEMADAELARAQSGVAKEARA